jgi:hypothetical protein
MKRIKKRAPLEVLQPGERNDYWEKLLRWRDDRDRRWEFLPGATKYSAEMYERNRDSHTKAV